MIFIPPETLLQIFSYLDLVCTTRCISLVCRRWRDMCKEPHLLHPSLDFSPEGGGEMGRLLSDSLFKKAISICPRVKRISMAKTHITGAGMEIIVKNCTELEDLDLSYCTRLKEARFELLLSISTLKRLNLLGTWKVIDPALAPLSPFLERGVKLSLTVEVSAPQFTPQTEETFFRTLLRLEQLYLHMGHDLARSFLDHPLLPLFSPTVMELEIGSRFASSSLSSLSPRIGLLTSLTSLSIISHTLQDLPSELAKITNLKSLLISSSRVGSTFTSLPPQITTLQNLESLNLCWNRMTDLPPSIANMTALRRLNISNNLLEELPSVLGKMTQLRRLSVAENRLRTLPVAMSGMVSLERLNIAHNSITHIPAEVFQGMCGIHSIDVQFNKLTSLPSTIANANLHELYANNNLLESVPLTIGTHMPQLKKLVLHENRLRDFPTHLEGLAESLKFLSLSGNMLENVPHTIGTLRNLRVLQLSHNRLQELPGTVMFMRKLRRMELQHNRFTSLVSLRGIQGVDSLKSVHFDEYLQEDHSEMCMCKFCVFARFDEAHFEEIVEGDAEFEEELINLFFNCMESDLSYMTKAFKEQAFEDIYFTSHKIKGALSNMGAVKLSHVCSLLESQARQHNMGSCTQLYEKLKLEYAHIKHVLVKRLQRNGKMHLPFTFSIPLSSH